MMKRMSDLLRHHAFEIWKAGVEAVRSERLIRNVIRREGNKLTVCGREFDLAVVGRIAVVGAGKAGAGMAAAVEDALGSDLLDSRVTAGWVNVPADCVRPLRRIHLHAARPAGVNEPSEEGVFGSREILHIVSELGPCDVCLVLISGGGSALLPAPVPEISLADKQQVTRFLMHAGATIGELNTVRKQLSQVKGGNLARSIRAGTTLTLIISDVVGDPLDVIASGPTVMDSGTPAEALAVLRKFGAKPPAIPQSILDYLRVRADRADVPPPIPSTVSNHVIGSNAVALDAAAQKATELGYTVHSFGSGIQGETNAIGRELAEASLAVRDQRRPISAPACLLSGGEPVVQVAKTDKPRKGGRNQQLVLAAVEQLWTDGMKRIAILSGGTDGEDGPTDAAGACADAEVIHAAKAKSLDPAAFLAINDSYTFFEQAGGLIKTGPTHTNVMDLRVALIAK